MQLPSPYFITPTVVDTSNGSSPAPTPPFVYSGPTLRDYCRVIAKRWPVIAIPIVCALALAGLIVFSTIPTYTAHCTILIERQTPQVLDIRQPGSEDVDESDQDNFYGTQYKILESRSLAAQVISKLGLATNPLFRSEERHDSQERNQTQNPVPPQDNTSPDAIHGSTGESGGATIPADVVNGYLDDLDVQPELGTRLVTVAFTTPDPLLSARIVNAHIQGYIARGTQLRAQASESAEHFLEEKLVEIKTRVEQSEAALNGYRRQRGIVADSSDDKTKVVTDRLVELNKALTEAATERIGLDAQVHLLDAQDYKSLPAVISDPLIQSLMQEQAKVDADYAGLAREYKLDYPPLADLDAKHQQLQARIDREVRRLAGGVRLSYRAAVSREQKLRQEIDQVKTQALALNDASLQDAILAREVDTNHELYKNVLARMNEMGMAAGISASNVSVVDYAQPPTEASSPKTLRTFGLFGLFALFLGIVCVFILERFDDAFKDPREVEHFLGIPSLGVVPDVRKLSRTNYGSSRYLSSRSTDRSSNGTSLPAKRADATPVYNLDSFSFASEAYRAIRIGILLSRAERPPKVILITSGLPQEGKTATAVNTAIAFAQMGEKVLLIDADLRRPRCHEVLELPKHVGLTEILIGDRSAEEFVRPTAIHGLCCITAGLTPPNPGALLSSKRMATILSDLKKNYDCIVLDSAPLIPVTDTLHLASVVDGVLLVACPQTAKEDLRNVCSRLFNIRANILGVVLNRFPIASHYYRHYYHYDPSPEFSASEARQA
jgi:polysaccharide biosynthesis transport protein